MQKTLLGALVVAAALVLGIAFWMLGRPTELPGEAGPAGVAASAPAASAPTELAQPESEQPAAPAPSPPVAAEPALQDAEGTERSDASRTMWIEGTVALPLDTPPDERIEILAFIEHDPGAGVVDRPDDAPGELVDRALLDEEGNFRVGFPEGAAVGWLWLDGRYSFVSSSVEVALPGDGRRATFQPELGTWISGRLIPPADATSEELEEIGESISLRPDPLSAIGFNGISSGRSSRRGTEAGEDLTYEFGGVSEDDGLLLRAVPEHLAAFKSEKFSTLPGQHIVLDVPLARGASVAGRVLDGEGNPVADADLAAEQDPLMFGQGAFKVRSTESEQDGTFVLTAVATGKTSIKVEAGGFLEATEMVELAEGEHRTGVDFALDQGSAIAGVVLWPDRTPVQEVEVEVGFDPSYLGGMEAFNAMRGASGEDDTDAQGHFRVTGLGKGPFVVEVEAQREAAGGAEVTWKARLSDVKPEGEELELILAAPIGIDGVVVDDLGQPVTKFQVLAREKGGQGLMTGLGAETRSDEFEDEQGRFFLDGLRAGTWELFAWGEGYGRPEALDVILPLAEGEIVQVVVERAAAVTGRVLDPLGTAVPGATVGLKQTLADIGRMTMEEQRTPEAETDESGAFLLGGLATGRLELVAKAEGYASSEPVLVELAAAETVEDVLIELRVGGRLVGMVYDSEGGPQAGQKVLAQIPTDPLSQHWANTDGRGEFRIENMNPGNWQVMTFPTGSGDAPGGDEGAQDDMLSFFSDMKFTVAEIVDGEETFVELGAPPEDPVMVHGTLVAGDEPVDGALITFFADGAEGVAMKFTTSNAAGKFEMELAAPGRYAVNVQKMLGTGQQQSVEYSENVPEGPDHELTLELPVGGIAGRVLGPDGQPRRGVRITLSVDGPIQNGSFTGGNYAEIVTDENGAYELLWLRPGSYSVAAGGAFLGGFFGDTGGETFGRQVKNRLRVSAGDWLRGIDFKLKQPGRIVGVVVDSTGSAVAEAAIFLRDSEGNPIDRISVIQTDSGGRFEYLGLEPGNYAVTARSAALVSSEAQSVHVREGEKVETHLTIAAGTMLIVGLSDDEGNPVRCSVDVTGPDGLQVNGLWSLNDLMSALSKGSISSEESRIGPLAPGKYRVKATAPDGRTANKPVTLRGQTERKLNLRLD